MRYTIFIHKKWKYHTKANVVQAAKKFFLRVKSTRWY